MKQDITLYLILPPVAFLATTISIAILPLLKFIDISAQLSQIEGIRPVIDYVLIMLIIYYGLVAVLILDNQRICESKLQLIKITSSKTKNSQYGAHTKQAIAVLQRLKQFKQYTQSKGSQMNMRQQKDGEHGGQVERKRSKVINVTNEDSDEESDPQNMLLSCHQVATSKKMF